MQSPSGKPAKRKRSGREIITGLFVCGKEGKRTNSVEYKRGMSLREARRIPMSLRGARNAPTGHCEEREARRGNRYRTGERPRAFFSFRMRYSVILFAVKNLNRLKIPLPRKGDASEASGRGGSRKLECAQYFIH
jgi:hypothetical protein